MEPFLNNDFTTSNNVTFGGYTNPTEVNKPKNIYTTTKEIPIEAYFNQPNLENNNNSYNNTYLPGYSEVYNNEYNNYSYPSDKIISEKSNINYDNKLLSKEYISNTNYNNYGNIINTSELNNISNFETFKPVSKKNENINYTYYDNNSKFLNPGTNVNYYSDNTTDFYSGLYTNNLESIPHLVSSTTNKISNFNLNEKNSYVLNNNISNSNYTPHIIDSSHVSYKNNVSKNKISRNNITLNNNNIYSVNAPPIKYKERKFENASEENLKGLNKISSKYLINIILNYIKDDIIKYKLFMYSKKFQKKLGFNPIDYQEKSISRTGIKLCNYLSCFIPAIGKKFPQLKILEPSTCFYGDILDIKIDYSDNFIKESLKNDFLHHLKVLKIKYIKNYLVYYFKKYKENKKDDSNLYIDIFCPFFDLLSNQDYFSELFIIPIVMSFIERNLLKNEYISAFNKLNKSQKDFSILFKYNEEEDLDFFKKYINLNKVRKLIIYEDETYEQKSLYLIQRAPSEIIKPPKKKKIADLFNILTSANNLLTNLVYLKLNLKSFDKEEFNIIENLNLFKSLYYLELEDFYLYFFNDAIFELKLDSLKVLKLLHCDVITISNNCCFHLKEFYMIDSKIKIRNSSLLKFPNLEKCKFIFYFDNKYIQNDEFRFNSIFDFSSFNNLKILNCEANDFLMLKNASLESLTVLSSYKDKSKEKEQRIIEKIISMKSLKELTLSLKSLDDNEISGIQGVNTSVEKLTIYLNKLNENVDCSVFNLQKKFPNVNNFSLIARDDLYSHMNIQIEEKVDCKINKLALYGDSFNIRLYCLPFDNLVEFDLAIFKKECNSIKESIPFFNNHCHLIFKSLISFKFRVYEIEFELLNNICDNLEKMPNLKTLELKCEIKVDKNFYDKLNKKISLLKLNDIKIEILNSHHFEYCRNNPYENLKLINLFNDDGIIIRK